MTLLFPARKPHTKPHCILLLFAAACNEDLRSQLLISRGALKEAFIMYAQQHLISNDGEQMPGHLIATRSEVSQQTPRSQFSCPLRAGPMPANLRTICNTRLWSRPVFQA